MIAWLPIMAVSTVPLVAVALLRVSLQKWLPSMLPAYAWAGSPSVVLLLLLLLPDSYAAGVAMTFVLAAVWSGMAWAARQRNNEVKAFYEGCQAAGGYSVAQLRDLRLGRTVQQRPGHAPAPPVAVPVPVAEAAPLEEEVA